MTTELATREILATLSDGTPCRLTPTSFEILGNADFAAWEEKYQEARLLQHSATWWLGDLIRYGEAHYGERYAQAIEATGKDYQTLRNAVWVANAIEPPRRRPELSFAHHAEVASLAELDQDAFLAMAATEGYTVRDLRRQIKGNHDQARITPLAALSLFEEFLDHPVFVCERDAYLTEPFPVGAIVVNPPEAQAEVWVTRGAQEWEAGGCDEVIFQVPVLPDRAWWRRIALCPVCLLRERPHTASGGATAHPHALAYLGPEHRYRSFVSHFEVLGPVYLPATMEVLYAL